MAETGRLTAPASPPLLSAVTLVRVAIVAAILVTWEAVAASGLLFRDVVPRLQVIGLALIELLGDKTYYWHLGVTAGEIGTALRCSIGLSLSLAAARAAPPTCGNRTRCRTGPAGPGSAAPMG